MTSGTDIRKLLAQLGVDPPSFQEFDVPKTKKPDEGPKPKNPAKPKDMPDMGEGKDPSGLIPDDPGSPGGGDAGDNQEPEFEVGKKVTIAQPMMGIRSDDEGVIVGVQSYMVGVVFQSQPQAPIWIDKELLNLSQDSEDGDGDGFPSE